MRHISALLLICGLSFGQTPNGIGVAEPGAVTLAQRSWGRMRNRVDYPPTAFRPTASRKLPLPILLFYAYGIPPDRIQAPAWLMQQQFDGLPVGTSKKHA